MAKVATDFIKHHNWTFETPSSELVKYTEKINKSLRDDHKREEGRDTVNKIAQQIVENDYLSEKIKQISYDLGSSVPNPVERLEKCDFSLSPSKEDLVDVMIMLSMQPADVTTLRIDKYKASDELYSIVNVNPINLILAKHGITSKKLRKIGADHAFRIYGVEENIPIEASIDTFTDVNCISQKHIGKVNLQIGFNDSKKYKSTPVKFIVAGPDWPGSDLILEGPWFQETGTTLDVCNSKLLLDDNFAIPFKV
ncbi:hypothetical protein C1646_777243 [Rhizophagus diaphanus]|nr:hypothetical protein C1646_777243 [Rhizophagus diaphanus] [Rhizophagus sp. MUCL 43196]